MAFQVVEITDPGHWLSKARGFLVVRHGGKIIGQVPLDDIVAVIIAVPGCSLSTNLLDQLAQRNIPLVVCGDNYMPSSWTLPVQGYNRQFTIMQAQIKLSEPKRKRAWQHIIRAKINNQAQVLARSNQPDAPLLRLAAKVRSGDPDNYEAQAARMYWQPLFGNAFRRNQKASGLNAALNYSYAIVRACVARGISSAGLHPSFSLHHKNPQNPFNLVDDLMEPFRPIVDLMLRQQYVDGDSIEELTGPVKSSLATITTLPLPLAGGSSPLSLAAVKVCRSFAEYCLGEANDFICPELPLSVEA